MFVQGRGGVPVHEAIAAAVPAAVEPVVAEAEVWHPGVERLCLPGALLAGGHHPGVAPQWPLTSAD